MNKNEFINLYLLCFTEDTVDDALQTWQLTKTGKLLCHRENGRPVAMLLLLPAVLRAASAYALYYIFAACTHPDYRRRGIMEHLLQTAYTAALADGKQGVFLRPANDALARYYTARHFSAFSHCQTVNLPPRHTHILPTAVDFTAFVTLRQTYLPLPYMDWPLPFLKMNYTCCNVYSGEKSLLVCEKKGGTLCVRELFGENGSALAAAVAAQLHCKKILCRRFGAGAPYALARSTVTLPETYVGLTLDAF